MSVISVRELQRRLKEKPPLNLVDVREMDEWQFCKIPGAMHLPLGRVPLEAHELLDPESEIVVYCHHGMRSAQAQKFLLEHGFKNVKNLTGGIEAWSVEIDPSVKRY